MEQRDVHIGSELLALLVVAPFMFALGRNTTLSPSTRRLSTAIGIGTLLVDGYLLHKFVKNGKQRTEQNNALNP